MMIFNKYSFGLYSIKVFQDFGVSYFFLMTSEWFSQSWDFKKGFFQRSFFLLFRSKSVWKQFLIYLKILHRGLRELNLFGIQYKDKEASRSALRSISSSSNSGSSPSNIDGCLVWIITVKNKIQLEIKRAFVRSFKIECSCPLKPNSRL